MKSNLVPVKVPYDTHFKILFSPLFTGSRKNICILFYFAWIWKVTETRRPQGDLKGWTQRMAGGAANSLGKMSLSYHCFLWHHEGLICRSALQRASEFLQNIGTVATNVPLNVKPSNFFNFQRKSVKAHCDELKELWGVADYTIWDLQQMHWNQA